MSIKAQSEHQIGAGKTILLVEDEDIVRALARKFLENAGFIVWEAATVASAESVWKREGKNIDLILADVQLPDGSTKALVAGFVRANPALPVIFTSGYSEDVLFDLKGELRGAAFIQKPFHPRELMKLIKAALEKTK